MGSDAQYMSIERMVLLSSVQEGHGRNGWRVKLGQEPIGG